MNQRNRKILRGSLATATLTAALFTSVAAVADLSDDLHKRLQQRWYITEVIAFHDASTLSNSHEQLILTEVERDTELVLEEISDAQGEVSESGALSQSGAPLVKPPPAKPDPRQQAFNAENPYPAGSQDSVTRGQNISCLLYTSDAADE